MESRSRPTKRPVTRRSGSRQIVRLVLGCLLILVCLFLIRPIQWQIQVRSSEDQPIFTDTEVTDYVSRHLPENPDMFWLPYRGRYFEPAYTTAQYAGGNKWLLTIGVKSKLFEKPFGYEMSVYFYELDQKIEIAGLGALRPG